MQRLLVVSPVAAGKTSVAQEVALRTGLTRIELDSMRFDERWNQLPEKEFRALVEQVSDNPQWIVDGNYASVRDILWRRADTVAWLDYSLSTVLRQLSWRTFRRIVTREDLGDGRRESLRRLVGPQSIILWAIRSHGPLRAEYERAAQIYGARVDVVRLRSTRETDKWLASIDTSRADS
jgi:adenylate kinase family enzyme